MKKYQKRAVFLLLIASPILFLAGILLYGRISGIVENHMMQREISSYVLENRDAWEKAPPKDNELILYECTGIVCAGVDYGYYYSADDTYNAYINPRNKYRNGYRNDGYPDDPTDWYFTSKICDHWYYYEIHDG